MLEIRYNKNTKELTGWWGSRFGNWDIKLKNRPDEAMAEFDIPIPDKPLGAWLCDGMKLAPDPSYTEPLPPRDYLAEIDKLKADTKELIHIIARLR